MAGIDTSKNNKFGDIVSAEMRKAENGYVVIARDKNYNQKEYIAKSVLEANKILKEFLEK